MKYVGFSEYYHDAGFAIIDESGVVDFATHGERYSKKKNDAVLPEMLWDMVGENDHVSFYEDHTVKFDVRGGEGVSPSIDRLTTIPNVIESVSEVVYPAALVYDAKHLHHESHCAAAFYTRPWDSKDDTVLVSIDVAL